jgi:hypothetical protein
MKGQDFHIRISVDATPEKVFKKINRVTEWWTENMEGHSQMTDDEFIVRFGDVHCSTQKLIEVVPDKKVVWLVTDSALSFINDKHEWTNTKICFEISQADNKTHVDFTHFGLSPESACYDACSDAWGQYLKESLQNLVNTGQGKPARKEQTITSPQIS